MFFSCCHERETKKKFWVPIEGLKIAYECLADRENSSSLSSLQVSVGETYNEGIRKKEQPP